MNKLHELKKRDGEVLGSFKCISRLSEHEEMYTSVGWVAYGCPFYCPICGESLSPQHEKVVIY